MVIEKELKMCVRCGQIKGLGPHVPCRERDCKCPSCAEHPLLPRRPSTKSHDPVRR